MARDEQNLEGQPEAEEGADEQSTGRFHRIGSLGRYAREHRLLASLVVAAALATMCGLTVVVVLFSGEKEKPVTVEEALETLDGGLYDQAHAMGKRLQDAEDLPGDSYGVPAFIMGAALAYEADRSFTGDKKPFYLLASRYLAQARELGVPPDREGEELFQLGRTLFLSGQIPASRPIFEQAVEAAPRHRSQILWLLTEAHLTDANPQYDQALTWNDKYLADRVLRPADRRRGLLQRARILLGLNRKDECLTTLDEIPAEAKDQAEALVIKAAVTMATADEMVVGEEVTPEQRQAARGLYDQAIEVLQAAQGRDTLSTQVSRKAMFLTAVCLRRMEEFSKALEQFAYTSRSNPETSESLAAGFRDGRTTAYARRSQGKPWRLTVALWGR